MELPKYEKGVDWLHDILYNTRFTVERLRVVAKRLTSDIAGYKRKGNTVVRTMLRSLVYSKGMLLFFLMNKSSRPGNNTAYFSLEKP